MKRVVPLSDLVVKEEDRISLRKRQKTSSLHFLRVLNYQKRLALSSTKGKAINLIVADEEQLAYWKAALSSLFSNFEYGTLLSLRISFIVSNCF